MAKKLFPLKRNGRFYFDEAHVPESFLLGTFPSSIRSFVRRTFNVPADAGLWVDRHRIEPYYQEPQVTWLGHSSFLIQMQGVNLLTDPIFDKPFFMYPRMLPLGIDPTQLPPIHAVLISHNHRDHMDESTLLYLKQKSDNNIHFLVPYGDKAWFVKRGFTQVSEFEWEQEYTVFNDDRSGSVTCTFVPAYHWSRRGLFDKNRSLWGGWVVHTADMQLYFAGDTAYSPDCFARIKYLFPSINAALMPIGPGEPRSWMKHSHVDAHEAGQAFLDVGAQTMIPMHWGTFSFGNDRFDAPLVKIQEWWDNNKEHLVGKQFAPLKIGQRWAIFDKK